MVCGCNGGIWLGCFVDKIIFFDVVRVIEDNFLMVECFDFDVMECLFVDSCGLNLVFCKVLNVFFEVLL